MYQCQQSTMEMDGFMNFTEYQNAEAHGIFGLNTKYDLELTRWYYKPGDIYL